MTTVYRLFDDHDVLLYVGVADRWVTRMSQHRSDKAWFKEVSRVALTHFPTREEALEAEKVAIISEDPRHNVAGRAGGTPKLATVSVPVRPSGLVGLFFHSDAQRGWQGRVSAEIQSGLFLVRLFDWVTGAWGWGSELVPIDEMRGWMFYETAEELRDAYDYGGVAERWRAERSPEGP